MIFGKLQENDVSSLGFGDLLVKNRELGVLEVEAWLTTPSLTDEYRYYVEVEGQPPAELLKKERPDVAEFFDDPSMRMSGLGLVLDVSPVANLQKLAIRRELRKESTHRYQKSGPLYFHLPTRVRACIDRRNRHLAGEHIMVWIAGDNIIAYLKISCIRCHAVASSIHRDFCPDVRMALNCDATRVSRFSTVLRHDPVCSDQAAGDLRIESTDAYGGCATLITGEIGEPTESLIDKVIPTKDVKESYPNSYSRLGLTSSTSNHALSASSPGRRRVEVDTQKPSLERWAFEAILGQKTLVIVPSLDSGGALYDTLERVAASARANDTYIASASNVQIEAQRVTSTVSTKRTWSRRTGHTYATFERGDVSITSFDAIIVISSTLIGLAVELSKSLEGCRCSLIVHELQDPVEWALRAEDAATLEVLTQGEFGSLDVYSVARGGWQPTNSRSQTLRILESNRPRRQLSKTWMRSPRTVRRARTRNHDPKNKKLTLVLFGPLTPHKNQKLALDCVSSSELLRSATSVLLVGAQDGEILDELSEIRSSGVSLEVLPMTQTPWRTIGRPSLLVVPSATEFMPRVVFEALDLGHEVLCTDAVSPSLVEDAPLQRGARLTFFRSENLSHLQERLETILATRHLA